MSDKPVNKISLSVHKDGDFQTCWQLQIDCFFEKLCFVLKSRTLNCENSSSNSFCYYSGKWTDKLTGFQIKVVGFEPH